jgi:hypothetical protein
MSASLQLSFKSDSGAIMCTMILQEALTYLFFLIEILEITCALHVYCAFLQATEVF